MDKKLFEKMNQKIIEIFENTSEVKIISESLNELSSTNNSFTYGLVVGRLYNSFYYQSRRLLQRDPTNKEFSEFIEILKQKQSEFLKKFSS